MTPVLAMEGVAKTRRDSERAFTLEVPRLTLQAGDRLALVGGERQRKSTRDRRCWRWRRTRTRPGGSRSG
ncbi:hypothetical protein CNY89_11825, partial [Amaricoccus sp. HAR-UPW-R2A-40]